MRACPCCALRSCHWPSDCKRACVHVLRRARALCVWASRRHERDAERACAATEPASVCGRAAASGDSRDRAGVRGESARAGAGGDDAAQLLKGEAVDGQGAREARLGPRDAGARGRAETSGRGHGRRA
eukprot:6182891-Pleurochrysis_carterae.AAC.1